MTTIDWDLPPSLSVIAPLDQWLEDTGEEGEPAQYVRFINMWGGCLNSYLTISK